MGHGSIFPHEVDEEDEVKNMTAQGCKQPDKITQRDKASYKPNVRLRPFLTTSGSSSLMLHVIDIREVRTSVT